MSDIPKSCEHCHKDLPFGKFLLTKKSSGAPKNALWSVKWNCYIQQLYRYLCAQCGFNIVNLRVVKHYEVPELVKTPSGASSMRVREVIAQDRPYLDCVLVTQIKATYDVALEADRLRYYEQIEALEAQRHARRVKRFEWNLRRIGTTVGDDRKGIQPLTEAQVQEQLAQYMSGSLGSGVAAPQVREVVLGGTKPRRSRGGESPQRVSSTSVVGVAAASVPLSTRPLVSAQTTLRRRA